MKKICDIHGIWEKKHSDDRCPKCVKLRNKTYDRFQRDDGRSKFYHSAAWKKMRNIVLNKNPFCVECGMPAQMVDHIVAVKDDWSKRLEESNLQPMCNSCHNIKEHNEGNRW